MTNNIFLFKIKFKFYVVKEIYIFLKEDVSRVIFVYLVIGGMFL